MQHPQTYSVIVVGGGHAGVEAALAAARMGAETLLLTHSIETIGHMSCNPAIGGVGKSQLVREIDALGGIMARAADDAAIHTRKLNTSKGPAVQATRIQADRQLYRMAIRRAVETQPHLSIFQQAVDDLLVDGNCVKGVLTAMGLRFIADAVILTTGTFLSGYIHIGDRGQSAGRAGDPPANALAQRLHGLGFAVGRLKTGTPPRLHRRTVKLKALPIQAANSPRLYLSLAQTKKVARAQSNCYLAQTNQRTHDIIRSSLDRSPMFNGTISSVGPRYCPSIEDKVFRFADKSSHRIFIEPEGLESEELYLNGLSTSLPFDVQQAMVHSIECCEQAQITRPGYAIEYDYIDPRELRPDLQTRAIEGLYFAGQINGTTGYEEAAAQGLIAGINAVRHARGESPWWPTRAQACLGVLIDDLVTRGTNEPYRMFTSRVEYRLTLREDNADLRLSEIGRSLGVVGTQQWEYFVRKRARIAREQERLKTIQIDFNQLPPLPDAPSDKPANGRQRLSAAAWLSRPTMTYRDLMAAAKVADAETDEQIITVIENEARYAAYTKRQQVEIERLRHCENQTIADDFDYMQINGLSNELRDKLMSFRPATVGQASRIQGMTPAAISLLLIHLKHKSFAGQKSA